VADAHGGELVLDSRPSDAIALALRTEAPISVAREVIAEAGALAPEEQEGEEGAQSPPEAQEAAPSGGKGKRAKAKPKPEPDDDKGPRSFFAEDVKLEDLEPDDFGKYKM
jgi:bifunctional DNase/RNase